MGLSLAKSGKRLLPPTDGRIAIGKKGPNGMPTKLDYFLFTHPIDAKSEFAPVNTEMTEVMQKKYGEKPRTIKVVLPFHHPDEVFFTSYADWKGRTAWSCKSDNGNTAMRRQQNGSLIEVPCDYQNCKFRLVNNDPNKTTCRPNGILSVYIMDAPVVSGVWKFRTNAWGSVHKIQEQLELIFNIRKSLLGLEVELSVVMESQFVPDGKGGRAKQNVPVVQIKMPCTMRELADGVGTVYGDFKEIRAKGLEIGNIADSTITDELSMELSTPPSVDDENEDETQVEGAQNTIETSASIVEQPKDPKPSTETTQTSSPKDDDLW